VLYRAIAFAVTFVVAQGVRLFAGL